MSLRVSTVGILFAIGLGVSVPVGATPISIAVGDNDGYGLGVADGANIVWNSPPKGPGQDGSNYDGRSAAEKTATNGAQITDVYSAIYAGPFSPNQFDTANVLFPFVGVLNSATLTIDMAGFESVGVGKPRGVFAAAINGLSLPFLFNDGLSATVVRSFVLTSAQVSAANAAGQVIFTITRPFDGSLSGGAANNNDDFVAFDFFRLDGDVTVPEPGTFVLLGTGMAAVLIGARRRHVARRA